MEDFKGITQETADKKINNTKRFRKTPKGVLTNIYSKQVERSRNKSMPLPSYTLKEFHAKYLDDAKYLRIFNEWVKSGYNKYKKPSFDRIDCMKPYSFDNIQVMTWEENRYKQRMEASRIRATQLKATNIVTNEETIYKSVSDAVRKTGFTQGCISACLNGYGKIYKNCTWEYLDKPKKKSKNRIKKCEYCGKEFIYINKRQRFCSRKCGSMGNCNAKKVFVATK